MSALNCVIDQIFFSHLDTFTCCKKEKMFSSILSLIRIHFASFQCRSVRTIMKRQKWKIFRLRSMSRRPRRSERTRKSVERDQAKRFPVKTSMVTTTMRSRGPWSWLTECLAPHLTLTSKLAIPNHSSQYRKLSSQFTSRIWIHKRNSNECSEKLSTKNSKRSDVVLETSDP